MTRAKKRKYIIVAGVLILAALAAAWLLNRTTYTDFRRMQCRRVDLEALGVTPGKEDGLYGTATWVGEGYACTVEQGDKTGECISIPYVNWEMYDLHADTNGGYAAVGFYVAERTVVDGKICTGKSPYQYSNVMLTLILGEQGGVEACFPDGCAVQGYAAIEIQTMEQLEVSVLENAMHRTPDEVEAELKKAWGDRDLATIHWAQAISVRLPENRNWKDPGVHLSGKDPEVQARFGMKCYTDYVDRLKTGQKKFPQTAYFKVTYDVENTVTGERTTQSTGWISQNYTAYGLNDPKN
ncbi:MAG: hypothetical protein IJY28_09965 [Clostridia bacterium]|nr:hypothetical protein [Clostridia bacterium]